MKRPEKSSSQSAVVNLAIAAQFGLFCIETQCRNVFAYLNPLQVFYVLFFNLEQQCIKQVRLRKPKEIVFLNECAVSQILKYDENK